MTRQLTIAIDGPAAGGKGTIALRLAESLGYLYVDTGAMYRAVAWRALREGISWEDEAALGALAERLEIRFQREEREGNVRYRVFADGDDVTEAIRRPEVDRGSSLVARFPAVRQALVAKQRALAEGGGVVMEGRDITTVVLPKADVKFFITASLAERARRRYEQHRAKGADVDLAAIEAELAERDWRDSHRQVAPMRIPEEAIVVDTTGMTVEESVAAVERLVRGILQKTEGRPSPQSVVAATPSEEERPR